MHQPFVINDFESFQSALAQSKSTILYLGDNVGETVFDRVLIETLDRPVTYAVKAAPILNDATREDAISAGLDQSWRSLTMDQTHRAPCSTIVQARSVNALKKLT